MIEYLIIQFMDPVLKVIFLGIYSSDSILHLICGLPHVIYYIWKNIVDFNKSHIKFATKDDVYALKVTDIGGFPEPRNININMMPFILGKKSSLPKELQGYWSLISRCPINLEEISKIGYLTIHEELIEKGHSQRRAGLHTESPGILRCDDSKIKFSTRSLPWGGGHYKKPIFYGGIYMASNISDSCRVWNAKIEDMHEIVGPYGDVEHLRNFLGNGETMKSKEIWWLTDATPHESLPLTTKQYRQYFRVVTSEVNVWYPSHSTSNPTGVVPGPTTLIVQGDKFKGTELENVNEKFTKCNLSEEK
eukprot:TRINITY_DN17521_c0_g1_i1.p1 TRINITY_DN17521_c0_g1~~TRINITY_DN17521_c0_g1_i1.p1  ORF type:complete len:305 (-),score=10.67 TRINITY_DN17521_c0_g1_i1:116-1030(-)